jgi:hypothetical protein
MVLLIDRFTGRSNFCALPEPGQRKTPCMNCTAFFESILLQLLAAVNLAGTEATRANIHLGRFPVNDDMHALDVRRPAALGLAVGVADQIAGHDTLFADFTIFSHASSPPPC